MNVFPVQTSSTLNHLNVFSSESEPVKTMWNQDGGHSFNFVHSEEIASSSTATIMDETSQQSQTSNSSSNNSEQYAMEVEIPTNNNQDDDNHSDLIHTDLTGVMNNSHHRNVIENGLPKRKFCSLTQRRKKLVDKYIYEVLTKSKDYDYGEFGSNLWSALLLEYFREDKDSQVGIESIEHWAKHTSWGRRMRKAYDIGLQTIKDGGDALREFEIAKAEVFRKKASIDESSSNCSSKRGRKRKSEQGPLPEADPTAVTGMLNDHDYCKNPWLESFGMAACDQQQRTCHNFEQQFIQHHQQFNFSQDNFIMETEIVEEQVYDMGAIGGEVEV